MAGMRDIACALANQISDGIRDNEVMDVQVEPRMVLTPNPLTIDIYPANVARDPDTASFGDISGAYLFTIRARINTPDFEAAYDTLIALMDDEDDICLAAILLADTTLSGKAQGLDIRDQSGLIAFQHVNGTDNYLGCQWTALVIASTS